MIALLGSQCPEKRREGGPWLNGQMTDGQQFLNLPHTQSRPSRTVGTLSMEFVSSEISTIKSMSQRSLALTWARAAGENSYPTLDAFRPSSRGSDPKYLVAWKVEFNPSGRTFRALYQDTPGASYSSLRWRSRSSKSEQDCKTRCKARQPFALRLSIACFENGLIFAGGC